MKQKLIFETPLQLRGLISAFQQSRIILSAFELKLFSVIGNRDLTSASIAIKARTMHRATDRLLNALVVIGLMQKKGGKFSNTLFSKQYLCENSPDFLAGIGHSINQWDSWSKLTQVLLKSNSPDKENVARGSASWANAFIAAMHDRAYKTAPQLVAKVRVSGITNMIDIGGGSGAYSMGFIQAVPDLKSIVFDLPHIIPITKKYIAKHGYKERILTRAGNYLTDSFGKGFDLALLSAIIHINSPEENSLLMRKCADCLSPGGQIVIQDHVMNADRTQPAIGAIFAINMIVGTRRGDTYTYEEISSWLREAGFYKIKKQNIFHNALVTAVKK